MSRNSKISKEDIPERNMITTYWRLLRQFAFRYWFRLGLGIVAGLLVGGALAAGLRVMDVGVNVFESGEIGKTTSADTGAAALVPAEPERRLQEAGQAAGTAVSVKEDAKRTKLFDKVNRVFRLCKIDIELGPDSVLTFDIVLVILALIFGFFLAQSLCEFINKYMLRWVGMRVITDIRMALYNCVLSQSLSYFSETNVGHLVSRCTNDVNAVEHVISVSVSEIVTAPIYIAAAVQFIVVKTIELDLGRQCLMMLCALPFCIIPILLISNILKRYERNVLKKVAQLVSVMQESFSGVRVVKAFFREEYEERRFLRSSEKYFKTLSKAVLSDALIQPTMQLSAIAMATAFIFICCFYHISLGSLIVIGFAAHMAYKPLKDLAKINSSLQKSAAASERIFALLDTRTALPEAENPVEMKAFKTAIEFKDVSFSYSEGEPVLQNVSFRLERGRHMAIVGATGSGKSTVANLLARFYDPSAGAVTIDGVDLRNMATGELRNMVGIVSQDTFLFNDTIAANIRYGRLEASDEEVLEAASQANAMEFISECPDGMAHQVGERGVLLSGGQKQRLAIARAIVKNPPILILDEATSALDSVTEHLVQEALNNVMKDRTVLSIAHRLSTIKQADTILVLEKGRIVETGTHEQLYEQNGVYRRLCDIQYAEYAR